MRQVDIPMYKPNSQASSSLKKLFEYRSDGDFDAFDDEKISYYNQWSTSDSIHFLPTATTVKQLVPGTYDIKSSQANGIYFEKIPVVTHGIIRFPETNSEKIVLEIQKFWEREKLFRDYRLTYKRGVMLYGPPGSGKTSAIQLVMRDVIERGGVVINFLSPGLFLAGIRKFREIQPETPIVVLMEDIDSIIEINSESEVLNVLDGVNQIEKAVFLATTNYPERLGDRIINRPSRFDKRFKMGHPNPESRHLYLEFIMGGSEKVKEMQINLEKWVEDTEDFSLAHLKELFVAVVILGDHYDDALQTLMLMREENLSSNDDNTRKKMGF